MKTDSIKALDVADMLIDIQLQFFWKSVISTDCAAPSGAGHQRHA